MGDGQTAEIAQSPFAGPIVITRGGTYRGNWESTDPATYAVRVTTSEPVLIEKSRIRSSGNAAGNNTPSATPDSVFNNVVEGSYGQPPDPPLDFEREKQAYGDWLQTVHAARVTLGPGAFAPVVYYRRARHVPRPLVRRSSDPCCR
jgi:hypothetical protein